MKKATAIKAGVLVLAVMFLFAGIGVFETNRYSLVSLEELKFVRSQLTHLSTEERQALSFFFTKAILWEEYAYPLVDYKPMSICSYFQEAEDLPIWGQEIYRNPPIKNIF